MQVRGTMVAWIMNGLRSAVANADSSSVLFWSKVFRLASEDTLRWVPGFGRCMHA